MRELRVDNIVMDGRGIRFEQQQGLPSYQRLQEHRVRRDMLESDSSALGQGLDRWIVGAPPWALPTLCAAAAALGAVAWMTVGLAAGPAIGILYVVSVVSALGGFYRHRRRLEGRKKTASSRKAIRDKVRAYIEVPDPENTIDRIAERLSLPLEATLAALQELSERDLLVEDLNTETGTWFYTTSNNAPNDHMTLDERIEQEKKTRRLDQ